MGWQDIFGRARSASSCVAEIKRRVALENVEIFWAEETGVDNCEIVGRRYAPKGHPPVLPVETKRERVNMISAISQQGNLRYMIYKDSMNQQKLIAFLLRLIAKSERKIYFIMDNLRVHHGKLASAWSERHKPQIEAFYLPPYAPGKQSGRVFESWTEAERSFEKAPFYCGGYCP